MAVQETMRRDQVRCQMTEPVMSKRNEGSDAGAVVAVASWARAEDVELRRLAEIAGEAIVVQQCSRLKVQALLSSDGESRNLTGYDVLVGKEPVLIGMTRLWAEGELRIKVQRQLQMTLACALDSKCHVLTRL